MSQMKETAQELTRKAWSPDYKEAIQVLSEYGTKLGAVGTEAAAILSKMDADSFKRAVLAGSAAAALTLAPTLGALADDVGENVPNFLEKEEFGNGGPAYLAILFGTAIPCVFLITLFIQSTVQGTANNYRDPDSIGGTRFEDM